jgi:hypothetical protein
MVIFISLCFALISALAWHVWVTWGLFAQQRAAKRYLAHASSSEKRSRGRIEPGGRDLKPRPTRKQRFCRRAGQAVAGADKQNPHVVPATALAAMPDGMPPALIVERFDIRESLTDERMLALADLCSVLDLPATAKYSGTMDSPRSKSSTISACASSASRIRSTPTVPWAGQCSPSSAPWPSWSHRSSASV